MMIILLAMIDRNKVDLVDVGLKKYYKLKDVKDDDGRFSRIEGNIPPCNIGGASR